MEIGTSYGLAFSSGINAYLPLLSYAIGVRWFNLPVNSNFTYITQDWFMIALAILALADLVADKIPGVDHVWDAIHTVLRPLAGAVVAGASGSHVSGVGLPVTLALGGAVAGITHTTKAATRVASTATTAGCMNVVLSVAEDVVAVLAILASLFAPVIMIGLVVVFVGAFVLTLPRIIQLFRRRRNRTQLKAGATVTGGSSPPPVTF